LNDPVDGRPRLEPLSEEDLSSFLHDAFVKDNPGLSKDKYEQEKLALPGKIKLLGVDWFRRELSSTLNRELVCCPINKWQ
jgi:hypothetical protein